MRYEKRLYASPIFRLIAQIYNPLLNEIPSDRDAEIRAIDLKDDNDNDVVGAVIVSDDGQYRVYLIAKDDEHGRISVQYAMVTKEEDDHLTERDKHVETDTIHLHDTHQFRLFIWRLVNFLMCGVKPTVLGGEGE